MGNTPENKILEDFVKMMQADKWYVKLRRWISLQIWLIRCNLRNLKKQPNNNQP